MGLFGTYLILLSIIVLFGQLFQKSIIPIALVLVVLGMVLCFFPFFPEVHIDPTLVLNIFLPLLIYQISSFSSSRDMKKQARPIALLSIGHVLFITFLVAIIIHAFIPQMGWPLAFVLGAIVSPPDNVAIVSIAEKIRIPDRIFIILEGEGMFNDAAALTLFRFALAAAMAQQFSYTNALSAFGIVIIGEALYGFILGHLLGKLRIKISNTTLHIIASLVTPFLAYIPSVALGGSGIIATAMTGFVIGNQYTLRFTPEYRLTALIIWPTLAYAIQGILFLLVGLNMRSTLMHITSIPWELLATYVISIMLVVVIGRFVWVYGFVIFLPRLLFPSLTKKDPSPPWRYPFIVSWSGIRGGISLTAAFAIPEFTSIINGVDIRDLLIFIVFCIIFVTLVLQGLSLPYLLRKLGIDKVSQTERYTEHMTELKTRILMVNAALKWLQKYKKRIKHDKRLSAEVSMHIYEYQMLKNQFRSRVLEHDGKSKSNHDEALETKEKLSLLYEIIEVEKSELTRLWREDRINLKTRNKLIALLDHQIQHHQL